MNPVECSWYKYYKKKQPLILLYNTAEVLQLLHDNTTVGHLGIKRILKTYEMDFVLTKMTFMTGTEDVLPAIDYNGDKDPDLVA